MLELADKLLPDIEGKIAVAFSGGGDSTALLHALKDDKRAQYAFIVDHNLRPGSRREALAAKTWAQELGYEAKLLTWSHDNPKTGVQEKARLGRYSLLGEACRKFGVSHLLTAHTEDDQAETLLMRYERQTDWRGAAGMPQVSHGGLWPQLALVTLVRPLLNTSRQALRDYNCQHKLSWNEDPSNQNRDFARIRARDYLSNNAEMKTQLLKASDDMRLARESERNYLRQLAGETVTVSANGLIYLSRVTAIELTRHLLNCASGQGRVIDKEKIRRLHETMRGSNFKSATLAGAMVSRHKDGYIIFRDPVAIRGRKDRNLEAAALSWDLADYPRLWDGRYSATSGRHKAKISTVHAAQDILSPEQQSYLASLPHMARGTLPVLQLYDFPEKIIAVGHQSPSLSSNYQLKCLVGLRLEAALGGVCL